MAASGCHHMGEFDLVACCHDGEIGQVCQIPDIECAGVCRPVGADQAGPVDREADGKVLKRDIMDDLIVSPLQEG